MAGISAETTLFTDNDERPRGIFGTKIPASVCLCVGLLLFLLPFAELKCVAGNNRQDDLIRLSRFNMTFSNTGLGLAIGQEWKWSLPSFRNPSEDRRGDDWKKSAEDPSPNEYALVALILAGLGVILSFLPGKIMALINIGCSILTSAALIGLMIDLQKRSADLVANAQNAGDALDVGTKPELILRFTPWFYIAVISFLVAAFFSYKRLQSLK